MKEFIVSYVNEKGEEQSQTFYNLTKAKSFMKEHSGSTGVIYKTWSNGDFECVGVITLKGTNKTFVANTKQKQNSYC